MQQLRAEEAQLASAVDAPAGDTPMGEAEVVEPDSAELVAPEVSAELVASLCEMGFSAERATRALYATGSDSVEVLVNWLGEHAEDADLDTPLLVPANKVKRKLSKEEAKAAAEALRRSVVAKREAEEKASERLREKERVRAGKELLAAKKAEEDQERRRNIAWRQREKEEDAKARAKLDAKLVEDRRERRIKLGLPPDPSPEEEAAEAAKKAAKAEAEAAKKAAAAAAAPPPRPVSAAEKLRALLVAMKRAHAGEAGRFEACVNTLLTYAGNVAGSPGEEKFRRLRLGNPAFLQRVGGVTNGVEFLKLLGFAAEGEFLVLSAERVSLPLLQAAGAELSGALGNPFFGVL